ncbi:uncharacterized protein SPSK_06674 [Sporothrix schenckii 1099-18]|uniref:Uncharacterized protein n=2 Tax=Sporothrix schenckii TaxID=29908 RepID=U7PHX6_SPOS1|nr:uncharacterized protein SPSK_06674 [Sporothrix schenckii 1099-18]ERS95193.1 hypothetical protein HMPREF1624_08404 [Sporothrix schenckii ATCC 58251]KJR89982.1 hypothetical protein SPSK_06674 [Sporothrix schenckii 1099-18]
MSSVLAPPEAASRTTSPTRRSAVASVSSVAAAAVGAASATLRRLGLLSDTSLTTAEKGKAVAARHHAGDKESQSAGESDSDADSSVSLHGHGHARHNHRDYNPETDWAYELPLSLPVGAYCYGVRIVRDLGKAM